jgi:hypothetical protein
MKKILKLSFVTLLAVLAMSVMSYAAGGGGKHQKAAKESKRFTDCCFKYIGTAFSNPTTSSDWTTVDCASLPCDNVKQVVCSIKIVGCSSTFVDPETNTLIITPNGQLYNDLVSAATNPSTFSQPHSANYIISFKTHP